MTHTSPKRIMLKLSGEALMGDEAYGLSPRMVHQLAEDMKDVVATGAQLCVVLGAGNIFRGVSGASQGMDRATADYMGMLATVMNCLAMQNALEQIGVDTRVQSAIPMSTVSEPYIRRRALRHLEKGRVVIFAAGTGNPYFTTDMAAALRASEMNCDVLMKGTMVDGIYDKDPKAHKNAVHYPEISYTDVLSKGLKVMDSAAIALTRDNNMPVIVFDMQERGNIAKIMRGEGTYTRVIT